MPVESLKRLGPTVAGTWYPRSPSELERELQAMFASAPPPAAASGSIVAVIAPHAGFVYSGAVAAAGFRPLDGGSVRRVLLVGPSHYEAYDGGATVRAAAYVTPLGEVPLDLEAIDRVAERPGIRIAAGPFRLEHCLEAEIPFLQSTLRPGWRLLPVLVGAGSSVGGRERLAEALRDVVDDETLIVVSSDFTHFGPRFRYVPFREDVPRRIRELDHGALERILALDRAGFIEYVRETEATICGRDAIDVLLRLLPQDTHGTLEAYDTSGRITGDWNHSVSYASLVFRRREAVTATR